MQTLVISVPASFSARIRRRKSSSSSNGGVLPPGSTRRSSAPTSSQETSGSTRSPWEHVTGSVDSATRRTEISRSLLRDQEVSTSYGPAKSSSSTPFQTPIAIRYSLTTT